MWRIVSIGPLAAGLGSEAGGVPGCALESAWALAVGGFFDCASLFD